MRKVEGIYTVSVHFKSFYFVVQFLTTLYLVQFLVQAVFGKELPFLGRWQTHFFPPPRAELRYVGAFNRQLVFPPLVFIVSDPHLLLHRDVSLQRSPSPRWLSLLPSLLRP